MFHTMYNKLDEKDIKTDFYLCACVFMSKKLRCAFEVPEARACG